MTAPIPTPQALPADSWLTVAGEQVHVDTETVRAGSVRLGRLVQTRTETVEVTLRREVLVIDSDLTPSAEGVYAASLPADAAPAIPPDLTSASAPLVIVLREETPIISTQIRAYEQVTAQIIDRTYQQTVTATARHEEVELGDLTQH